MGFFGKSQPSPEPTDLNIKSVLLLDDDIDLADTLKALLETRNYIVTVVNNGVDGVKEVMAMDFDVIMCDMMMPKMAGDMFYTAIERTKPHLLRRFVFITANSDDPKVMDFLRRAECPVLYKPVMLDELIRSISLVIKQAEDEQRAAAAGLTPEGQ
jgi:DNA-binding response OmpR family regulator